VVLASWRCSAGPSNSCLLGAKTVILVLKDLSENPTGLLTEFGGRRLVDLLGSSIALLLRSMALLASSEYSSSDLWAVDLAFAVLAGSF